MIECALCTWRVCSDLPLPEAMPWTSHERPVDIEIRRGRIERSRPQDAGNPRRLEVTENGKILYDASPHARFLVTPGSVLVDSSLPADAPEWRVFLLGPIMGLLCYLRGALPLHASAIRVGTHAFALAGAAGAGKSTLAAALVQRRHFLVTDDVCPVLRAGDELLALPTFPALKLGSASLAALGIAPRGLPRIGFGEGKYLLGRPGTFHSEAVPLRRVYLIEDAVSAGGETIAEVRGAEIFERLGAEIYRPEIGRMVHGRPALFAKFLEAASSLEVRRLRRLPDLARIDDLASRIEADIAGI